eukprot:403343703
MLQQFANKLLQSTQYKHQIVKTTQALVVQQQNTINYVGQQRNFAQSNNSKIEQELRELRQGSNTGTQAQENYQKTLDSDKGQDRTRFQKEDIQDSNRTMNPSKSDDQRYDQRNYSGMKSDQNLQQELTINHMREETNEMNHDLNLQQEQIIKGIRDSMHQDTSDTQYYEQRLNKKLSSQKELNIPFQNRRDNEKNVYWKANDSKSSNVQLDSDKIDQFERDLDMKIDKNSDAYKEYQGRPNKWEGMGDVRYEESTVFGMGKSDRNYEREIASQLIDQDSNLRQDTSNSKLSK